MSETRQWVDPSGAARAAGDAPSERERARTEQEQPQAQPDGREQAGARQAEQPQAPGAAQAPGDDGRSGGGSGAGGDARAREADEDALRGDVDELVSVAAQRDDYLALAQRTQADFENYRKRVAKESAAAQERGTVKLAAELLPALDNLDRALEEGAAAAERDGRDAPLLEGVRLVRSELHAALARMGIERFSPKGERFDPAEHEAMAQQPVPDAPSGTVVEVFQPGYRLGDNIIRPARVLVAA